MAGVNGPRGPKGRADIRRTTPGRPSQVRASRSPFKPQPGQVRKIADQSYVRLAKWSEQADLTNPGSRVFVIDVIAHATAKAIDFGKLSPREIASVKYEVAKETASIAAEANEHLIMPKTTLEGLISRTCELLRQCSVLVAIEDLMFEAISQNTPERPGTNLANLAAEISQKTNQAGRMGATVSHDSWFTQAVADTIPGEKNNGVVEYTLLDEKGNPRRDNTGNEQKLKVRARPFMLTAAEIQRSNDQALVETMYKNNEGGVLRTLAGLVDAANGRSLKESETYVEDVKGLANPFEGVVPKAGLSEGTKAYLGQLGWELAEVRNIFLRGGVPEWSKYQTAAEALATTHDRFIEDMAKTWPEDYWARDQMVPFSQLTPAMQFRDVPVTMAAVYSAMVVGEMIPPVRTATNPNIPG